jgi:hypothetical protein
MAGAGAGAGADMVEVDTLIFDIDDTLYDAACLPGCLSTRRVLLGGHRAVSASGRRNGT